jgi:hypothetical protein
LKETTLSEISTGILTDESHKPDVTTDGNRFDTYPEAPLIGTLRAVQQPGTRDTRP